MFLFYRKKKAYLLKGKSACLSANGCLIIKFKRMTERVLRVLVVDDDPDWRETLAGLLRDRGEDVVVASDAEEAARELEKGSVER